jgi:hypothetical protein
LSDAELERQTRASKLAAFAVALEVNPKAVLFEGG